MGEYVSRCCLCGKPFLYPAKVKWISEKESYAHAWCKHKKDGWWAIIKGIFNLGKW